MKKQIGKTKDVGFQFGIRKTFSASIEQVWGFMFSAKGWEIWLGILENPLERHLPYTTDTGIAGKVSVFKPFSHIRLSWKKKEWENDSTLQIRVIGNQEKTTIAIHQEKLLDANQRDEMKAYWNIIINKLVEEISKN